MSVRDDLIKKYEGVAPAKTTGGSSSSSSSSSSLRQQLEQKYGQGAGTASGGTPVGTTPAPAATTTPPTRANLTQKYSSPQVSSTPGTFPSLDLAFPSMGMQTSTPAVPVKGQSTIDAVKNVTLGLLSIPKAIVEGQLHPDQWQQEFEKKAYPTTGNPIIDYVVNPAGKAVTRFINPALRPLGEDVASAIIGNNPDSFNYDPKNIQYLPGVQKKGSQVVGDTAQAVLAAYTPSLFGKTAVGVASAPVKTALLTGARNGGEAGLFFGLAQVASQDLRKPEDITATLFMNIAGGSLLGAVTSGAIPVAREGFRSLTEDISTQYQLPQTVYIDARKVKDIFQTGSIISPDESAMIRSLGLNGTQYRQAIRDGINIAVPAQKVVTIADKPWWAKVKGAFGIEPSSPNVKVEHYGEVSMGAETRTERLLPAGDTPSVDGTPQGVRARIFASEGLNIDKAIANGDIPASMVYADQAKGILSPEFAQGRVQDVANKLNNYWPGLGDRYLQNVGTDGLTMRSLEEAGAKALDLALAPELPDGKPMLSLPGPSEEAVAKAFTAPVNAGVLAKLANFNAPEQAAFGRNVIQALNESLGTNITNGDLPIPDNVKVVDQPSVDGRPAQYNGQTDQIELFLPNLMNDLAALSRGQAILIHPDSPYTEVVKLQDGESIKDLVTRYVKEVILHEAAHQKTPTSVADKQELQTIDAAITKARLDSNQDALIAAQRQKDALQMKVENAANAYLKANRVDLEKEIFGKKGLDGTHNFRIEETDAGVRAVYTDGPSAGAAIPGVDAPTRPAALKQIIQLNREGTIDVNMRPYEAEVVAPKAPNRFERRALGIPDTARVSMTEKRALRDRIRARAQGAREGFSAGKKEGVEQTTTKLKSRYESTIEKIQSKTASAAEKRAELIDYSRLLAFRDRGKFLKAINNTKTNADFEAVLDRMRKAANLTDRKNLITSIIDELKSTKVKKRDGIPDAKFAYEQQKALDEIRKTQASFEERAKDLRKAGNKEATAYGLAQMEIAEKISAWQTEHPDEIIPADILHQIEVLKTVGLRDMTARELRAVLASIQSLKENGRMLKELERFNRETEVQRIKDNVFDVITGGEPLPSESLSIKRRDESKREFFRKYTRDSVFAWPDLLDKFSVKDKESRPYESQLSRFGEEVVNTSFNDQNRGERNTIGKVQKMFEQAYGTRKKGEVLGIIGELQKRQDLGPVKHTDGKTKNLSLSREEAMQYTAWHQDETLDGTFEQMGWGEDVWKAIDGLLTPEDRKMIDLGMEFYRDYYEQINEVYSRDYGVDLPFNDTYSPVQRDLEVTVPENVLLAQEGAKYATAKNGSLKERVKNNIELKPTGYLENLNRHIAKMEHYMAWSDSMFKLRRVFGDKQIRQAIADLHGTPYLRITDNFLNDFARDGVAREKINVLADELRKRGTMAILGLNIKSAIKQVPGVLNYGIEVPAKDFFSGITGFWSSPLQKARFLYENSEVLQERFGEGYERDIKFTIDRGYDKKLAGAQNLSEILFIPMRNADKLTVYMGSWAAFQSKFKEITGHSFKFNQEVSEDAVKEAIFYAERVTNRTQESSRLDTLAPLQRDGSWAKLFTMFQSQPSKYIRLMGEITRNVRAGRETKARGAKRLLWAWVIAPLFWNLLNDALTNPDYQEGAAAVTLRTIFLGPLTYPLILGQMVDTLVGWAGGRGFEYKPSPAFGFMDDLVKSMQQYTADDAVDGTTYMLDAAGKLGGVPTTIVTKPIRQGNKDATGTARAPKF